MLLPIASRLQSLISSVKNIKVKNASRMHTERMETVIKSKCFVTVHFKEALRTHYTDQVGLEISNPLASVS